MNFCLDNFGDAAFMRYHIHHGLRRVRQGQGYSPPPHGLPTSGAVNSTPTTASSSTSASVFSVAASNNAAPVGRCHRAAPTASSAVRLSSSAPPRPPAAAFQRRATSAGTAAAAAPTAAHSAGASHGDADRPSATKSTASKKRQATAANVPVCAGQDGDNHIQTDLKNLSPEELDAFLKAARESSRYPPAEWRS